MIHHDRRDAPGADVSEKFTGRFLAPFIFKFIWTLDLLSGNRHYQLSFFFLMKSPIVHRLTATSGRFAKVMSIKKQLKRNTEKKIKKGQKDRTKID